MLFREGGGASSQLIHPEAELSAGISWFTMGGHPDAGARKQGDEQQPKQAPRPRRGGVGRPFPGWCFSVVSVHSHASFSQLWRGRRAENPSTGLPYRRFPPLPSPV